jgi:hypothetical protein
MDSIQKRLLLWALLGSLVSLAVYAQETSVTRERVERPSLGINIGPTAGTDGITGWGPQVSVFLSGVIYQGLHFGPELGYAVQEYQQRVSALGRIEYHPGGFAPVMRVLSFGAKLGPVLQYRGQSDWAFGFGPMLGVNIPLMASFTLGGEAGILFMAGSQFQSAVNFSLSARAWL